MSTHSTGTRVFLGTWGLLLLTLWSACVPGSASRRNPARAASTAEPSVEAAAEYDVKEVEPETLLNWPMTVSPRDFQGAMRHLSQNLALRGTPREAALEGLAASGEPPEDPWRLEGHWLAEVSHGQVLTLVPLDESPLTPEAQRALLRDYASWCQRRGGGDCLYLLDDGPFLRADDRRTLALALALGGVLDEALGALEREVASPHAVLSLLVWTIGLYAMLWLVPEPVSKGLAAALSVLLISWLGVDTLWGLLEGWARLASRAHAATRFSQLRGAGEDYARVLGENAARALLMSVAALTGRTLGDLAARVKALPGSDLAGARWLIQTQGRAGEVLEQVEALAANEALARAVVTVETVAATPGGPLAVVLLKRRGPASSATGSGPSVTVGLRHRGGNQQVILDNGQRWHLPRGASPRDIPLADPVGDQLQQAVSRAASAWGPSELNRQELRAINKALQEGKYWLARLLEREARGRFVERRVKAQFRNQLKWNKQGVDAEHLETRLKYEILSGSPSNLAWHGRRMAGELFRMITF
ncbi:hypothetical protein [Melittangium boletus]|uniref:Uncharacterized protein n=1 Tax=Melittangium boletus DSM 14713 TaxID=1294270 RepID=A0A250IEJ8_9BACT|nr:hypothetical protein [Melittangium boletus]ATB30185.1 hypothetical protein MEBOL_003640 [Melittangium boletus DSM 14713]